MWRFTRLRTRGLTWNYLAPILANSVDAHYVNRYYASPVLLEDGRIITALRCQIDARIAWPKVFESCDDGRSWGPELILRDDAGSWDLGYPRTVKLGDGKVISACYINNADDEIQCNGGVRHIAATVFTP